MKKYVCPICGYVHEGDNPPEKCPQCGCPGAKFIVKEAAGKMAWACEHEVGAAKGLDAEVVKGLEMNFQGECTEVGMYLAMSRQAEREGYPEVAEAYKRYAFEEAEHAAKFAELLGDVLTRWPRTRPATAPASKACSSAISPDLNVNQEGKQNGILDRNPAPVPVGQGVQPRSCPDPGRG